MDADAISKYGSGPAQVNAIINDVCGANYKYFPRTFFHLFFFFLIEKEADLAPCGIIASHSKYQKVDFTVPWMIEHLEIVVPWPEEEDSTFSISVIQPFQPMVLLVALTFSHFLYLLLLNLIFIGLAVPRS